MYHFLNYNLVHAAMTMIHFERFLAVKIAERVQEYSRRKCNGCVSGYSLDQLHLCMTVPLKNKIGFFLPRVKEEAISRMDNLFHIFQQMAWIDNEDVFIRGGRSFIANLEIDNLVDRRYINEDTVVEYPYNTTWICAEEDFLVAQIEKAYVEPLAPILPLDPADEDQKITPIVKKNRKRKNSD